MKLLLINPKFPESFWSFKWALDNMLPGKKTLNPPLGLATLAALCPADWDVEIIDENVQRTPLSPKADIIGICGMGVQFNRQKELITFYKRQGYFVVAGGSYASLCPELYEPFADCVIAGEAEYIWPEFCHDFEKGQPRKLYEETGVVSLSDSPVPRFDLLDLTKYRAVTLQFSRGCPFRCEFCDIIVMFGRKPRTKPIESVERELDELRARRVTKVFFVDDNFIGNKASAKELLASLARYQRKHNYRFHFGTEASLNMANDDELLELFREANFDWVFIGIESPDEQSLKETKKTQNMNQDILYSVRKIYSYGIEIIAGFIIGFDNDTTEVFERQYEFIMKSGIQSAMIGLLTAIPKTPLYERLKKENRLIMSASARDNSKLETNIIPKRMTYDQMIDGYSRLYHRLFSNQSIADRINHKTRHFTLSASSSTYPASEALSAFRQFLLRGILPGGFSRIYHFLRSLPLRKPSLIPMAIGDWVVALSTRDYLDRHFVSEYKEDTRMVRRYVEKIQEAFHKHRQKGALGISFSELKNGAAAVSISMRGWLDRESFGSIARHMEYLLKNSRSSITLSINEFHQAQIENMGRLLDRLAKYGDRIQICLDESSRRILPIDSSTFNLVLIPD